MFDVFAATVLGDEPLRHYVNRVYAEDQEERHALYEDLLRKRARIIERLNAPSHQRALRWGLKTSSSLLLRSRSIHSHIIETQKPSTIIFHPKERRHVMSKKTQPGEAAAFAVPPSHEVDRHRRSDEQVDRYREVETRNTRTALPFNRLSRGGKLPRPICRKTIRDTKAARVALVALIAARGPLFADWKRATNRRSPPSIRRRAEAPKPSRSGASTSWHARRRRLRRTLRLGSASPMTRIRTPSFAGRLSPLTGATTSRSEMARRTAGVRSSRSRVRVTSRPGSRPASTSRCAWPSNETRACRRTPTRSVS